MATAELASICSPCECGQLGGLGFSSVGPGSPSACSLPSCRRSVAWGRRRQAKSNIASWDRRNNMDKDSGKWRRQTRRCILRTFGMAILGLFWCTEFAAADGAASTASGLPQQQALVVLDTLDI